MTSKTKVIILSLLVIILITKLWIDNKDFLLGFPDNQKYKLLFSSHSSQDNEFSFLVGGHLYANPESILQIPMTQQKKDLLFISLGDMIYEFTPRNIQRMKQLISQLELPFFNAPGNHDLHNNLNIKEYEKVFGPTYGYFIYNNTMFILLNAERPTWHITGEQLDFLAGVLAEAKSNRSIQHIFIASHKVIFAYNSRYQSLFKHSNAKVGWDGWIWNPPNFRSDILPLLLPLAKSKNVFWLAGDVGTPQSYPLFFDHDPFSNITFVATGVGGTVNDSLLRVYIKSDQVEFEVIPVSGQKTQPLSFYGLEFWNNRYKIK